jgi:hypothetical protein
LNLSDKFDGGSLHEAIVSIESDCVTNKINGVIFKTVFLKHLFGGFINFDSFVGFWVAFLEVLYGFQKLLASSLFKKSH